LLLLASPAAAQIVGQWRSNFGQGIIEYSIVLDREERSYITISDASSGASGFTEKVSVYLAIDGEGPEPNSQIKFSVDGVEVYFEADDGGSISTACRACAASFDALWHLIRQGDSVVVEFDRKSKRFPLRGSAQTLPRDPPPADFYR
jgi:hypothetical protein